MKKLILNLCAGKNLMADAVNVDNRALPGIGAVVDLNALPWPWDDSSVDGIVAKDALEHLAPLGAAAGQRNIFAVMGECWRVLKPGARMYVMVPSTDGRGAWQDPTHVTFWNRNTFHYFTPGRYEAELYDTKTLFEIEHICHVGGQDDRIVWVEAILVPAKGDPK